PGPAGLRAARAASGHPYPVNFDEASSIWRDGELRLAAVDPDDRPAVDRVIQAIDSELRRRLGAPFSRHELVKLYEQGTDWCLELAFRVAPNTPAAWDLATVSGAAFSRYVREASDLRSQIARPPGMDPA
ncbi:MAG: hypothetical protein ACRDYC_12225, partial [Acidimicrobiales bacterium]